MWRGQSPCSLHHAAFYKHLFNWSICESRNNGPDYPALFTDERSLWNEISPPPKKKKLCVHVYVISSFKRVNGVQFTQIIFLSTWRAFSLFSDTKEIQTHNGINYFKTEQSRYEGFHPILKNCLSTVLPSNSISPKPCMSLAYSTKVRECKCYKSSFCVCVFFHKKLS